MSRITIACAAALVIALSSAQYALAAEADRLYTTGAKEFYSGNYDGAETMFKKALAKDPKHQSSLFMMGETVSVDIRRLDEAKDWYDKALERAERRGSHVSQVLDSMGRLYMKMGKYEDALACFSRILSDDPEYYELARVYNQMGVSSFKLDHYSDALDYFKHALKTSPDLPEAVFNMKTVQNRLAIINTGRYHERMGEMNMAIECYRQAIESYPNYVTAWYQLGTVYLTTGSYDEAVRHLERAWLLHQSRLGDNEIPYMLAKAYMARHAEGDDSMALALYEGLGPYKDSLLDAAELYREQGKINEAEIHLKEATAPDVNRLIRAEAYNQLGILYNSEGRKDEARESFLQALTLAPEVDRYKTPPVGGAAPPVPAKAPAEDAPEPQ